VIGALMLIGSGFAGNAQALPFECKVLREPARPFVRIVPGATEKQANAGFINAYGNEVRRIYGPNVRFLCTYPPSNAAIENVPGENSPYKACPSGKTQGDTVADALEQLQHDCGPPLSRDQQMYFVSYWAQAREQCRFAMANDHAMVLAAALNYVQNPKYLLVWNAAGAQLKRDGCTPATRQLAESVARYLGRTGDPRAERPFIATCLQREHMDVRKCRCYGDAIRLVDPRIFHKVYDGPAYGQVVPEIGPLWEGEIALMCLGVRPN
jgi:hypothetical protein